MTPFDQERPRARTLPRHRIEHERHEALGHP